MRAERMMRYICISRDFVKGRRKSSRLISYTGHMVGPGAMLAALAGRSSPRTSYFSRDFSAPTPWAVENSESPLRAQE
jgi:hypothetical protein